MHECVKHKGIGQKNWNHPFADTPTHELPPEAIADIRLAEISYQIDTIDQIQEEYKRTLEEQHKGYQ